MKWFLAVLVFASLIFEAKAQKPTTSYPLKNNLTGEPFPVNPSFPGGQKAFYKFLAKNLKWPNQDDVQGRVIISFIVKRDGHLTGFKVERSLGKDIDNEALRVLKRSPEWIPGTKNGKKVSDRYFMPINFTLSE